MKKSLLLFSIVSTLLINHYCISQVQCLREIHHTTIVNQDNYQENHILEFVNLSNEESRISIPCNQLGEITDLSVEIQKKGEWKKSKLDNNLTISTLDWSSFYSGVQYYQLPIPAMTMIRVSYNTTNHHSIFVSRFRFEGYYEGREVSYSLKIPKGMVYSFKDGTKITDSLNTQLVFPDSLDKFGVLHPSDIEAETHFVNWFENRTKKLLTIGEDGAELIKSLKGVESSTDIAAELFYFVQDKIKYVDIENGINAIVPRDCNETLKNGYGDCKDMATLLTALLRSAGFESHLAISRTNSKEDTLDFPSISLGNHMISVLRLNDQWLFLDPTEDGCEFGDPSYQILGTEVLILSDSLSERFQRIDNSPYLPALLELNYKFDIENKTIRLNGKTTGKMNLLFAMLSSQLSTPDESVHKIFDHNGGWELDSIEITRNQSTFSFTKVLPESRVTNIGGKTLLELSDVLLLPKVLSRFQFETYPKYPFTFNATIQFDRRIDQSSFTEFQLANYKDETAISWKVNLPSFYSEDAFLESQFSQEWHSLFQKPIILKQ